MRRIVACLLTVVVAIGLLSIATGRDNGNKLSFTIASKIEQPAQKQKPRLAVLLVFDQLRGDYLTKWRHIFERKGFGRLLEDGAWFQNCHYPYAGTLTAAGHATMATGCPPRQHGIIANSWYDRQEAKEVTAISDRRARYVPSAGTSSSGVSPSRRQQRSIGDALMEQTAHKGKVVSISIKERSAILLAALRATLCLWFGSNGLLTTSTFYTESLPAWVTALNQKRPADRWFGKTWEKSRPDLDYNLLAGPDDFKYEGTGQKQGKTFPHPITGGADKPGPDYYEALANSPFGNEALFELAKQAIEHEQLGQDDIPDLLCVSFSSNDYVGHCWGPDSQEVLDMTLCTDRMLGDFLDYLDQKVGAGNYLIVICSDHGICPLPEVMQAKGHKDAGRFALGQLVNAAENYLNKQLTRGEKLPWFESTVSGTFYFNHGTLKSQGLKQSEVEQLLATWLAEQPGIQSAYTRTELSGGKLPLDPIGEMVRQSFHLENSGDVIPVIKPYYLPFTLRLRDTGSYTTTHGSPHAYDTHVPLVVYGANVQPGIRGERVTPEAVCTIIAEGLHIRPPAGARHPVPEGLFR